MSLSDTNQGSIIDRSMRWIGVLDHPFYQDERNRFIWYEASAIGAQLAIVGGYVSAGLALFIFGRDATGPMWVMLAPIMIASVLMASYTARHSAEYVPTMDDVRSSRGLTHFAALAFWLTAYLYTEFKGEGTSVFIVGFISALGFGMVVGLGFTYASKRNSARRAEQQGDPLDR